MRLAVDDPSCIRARLVLSLALDGEAAAVSDEALAAARHLCGCRSCTRFAATVTAITNELRSLRQEPSVLRGRIDHQTRGGRS